MLTGRFPYPARSIADLPELWTLPVRSPVELVAELPAQLSDLVMKLLALDRTGRPASAAEVMELLGASAGLEPDRHDDLSLAYLTTPVLVGRDALLAGTRQHLAASLEGRGTTLVISGDAGSGRTRALDACILEAKLMGSVVLRAGASDGATGDYGAARTLARELLRALPEAAGRALAPQRSLIAQVVAELREPNEILPSAERRHVQSALRDWLLAVARKNPMFIAVDDVDRIDEPSTALLAALADAAENRRMVIAVTRQVGRGEMLALRVLDDRGKVFDLAPLSALETENLVRSVFGEADQVVAVARRIFETSQGNPRDTMELLHHLVQQRLARYEAGSWILPAWLQDSDLSSALACTLETRLSSLDPDARALAEALSVASAEWIPLEEYPELSEHRDVARTFRALTSLVSLGVVIPEGERYRFAPRGWSAWLNERLLPERKRELHARLAEVAERRKDSPRRLHHLLSCGQEAQATAELLNDLEAHGGDVSPRTLNLIERAIASTDRFDLPETTKLSLRLLAAGVASLSSDCAAFMRYAPGALQRLLRDSGRLDWEELGDDLPAPERLQRALMQAAARYESTPERERGFAPFQSIKRLARLYASYTGMSGSAQERQLLLNLPSLLPFAALSPAPLVIQQLVDGELALEEGRIERAREHFKAVRARIMEPDRGGIEGVYHSHIQHSMTFITAAIEARWGLPSALLWSDELEQVPRHRINAWRVRRAYYRLQGQIENAKRCQRNIELLELQDGPQPFQNASYRTELLACWLSDDLIGIKGFFEAVEDQARRFPRMAVLRQLAYCHYHRIRGEFQRALEVLTPALELAEPLIHIDWQFAAAARVELLTLLGRHREALEYAEQSLAICDRESLVHARRGIERVAVLALVAADRLEAARERAERLIAEEEGDGTRGTILMLCYGSRARVAIAQRDDDGFERAAGRCFEICEATDSPALKAQYERLRDDARRAGVGSGIKEFPSELCQRDVPSVLSSTASKRLIECVNAPERARCALLLLLEEAAAESGFLFGIRQGLLEPIAAVPAVEPPSGLRQSLQAMVRAEFDGTSQLDVDMLAASASTNLHQTVASLGFVPVILFARQDQNVVIAGAAAIARQSEWRDPLQTQICEIVAGALVENSDVDPLVCLT
jgi:hypothetical protein